MVLLEKKFKVNNWNNNSPFLSKLLNIRIYKWNLLYSLQVFCEFKGKFG